jgi:hypothetical protein
MAIPFLFCFRVKSIGKYNLVVAMLMVICCISTGSTSAQMWTGSVSTAWEISSNWSTGVVPTTATDAIVPASPWGGRFPIISTGTQGVKSLTIQAGASVTQTGGILQVSRDWKNSGTFNATAGTVQFTASSGAGATFATGTNNFYRVLVNSGVDPGFNNVTGSNVSIAGDFTLNNTAYADATTFCTFTFNGSGDQNIYSALASAATFGNLVINKSSGRVTLNSFIKVNGNLTVSSGGLSTGANYGLTISGTAAFNGGTFDMNGSSIAVTGSWTNSGCAISGGACAVTVSGDVTRSGGSVSAPTANFSLGGNFTNNTSAPFNCPIVFTGTGKTISGTVDVAFTTLSVTGTVTINRNSSASSFTIPPDATSTTLTLATGVTLAISGNVALNQPTAAVIASLNVNAGTVTVGGNVILGGNNTTSGRTAKVIITTGTLNIDGNLTYNCAASTPANAVLDMAGGAGNVNLKGSVIFTNGSGTLSAGTTSSFTFNGTSDQYVANAANFVYNILRVNKASGTLYATANLSLGSGTLQIDNGSFNTTSANNYSLTADEFILNGGDLVLNNSSVTLTGNWTNSGTAVTGGACIFSIGGDYTINAGSVTVTSGTLTVGGNWVNNNNAGMPNFSTVTFTGSAKTIGGTAATSFPDVTITTGSVSVNTNTTCTSLTFANNNVANSLSVANGLTLTVNGDVTINQASGGGVAHALNVNSGTVTINGNAIFNVTANNAGRTSRIAVTTGTLNVNGNITMNNSLLAANSIIDMSGGAGNLNLTGNFTLSSLGTLTPGTTSTFNYNGTTDQLIAGGSAISYNSLRFNKASGTASLTGALSLSGNLVLDNGILTTTSSNYNLTANNCLLNGGTLLLNNSTLTANGNLSYNGSTITGGTCALLVNGDVTRNAGTISYTSCSLTVGGNWVNNLATPVSATPVTFTGTAKSIGGSVATQFKAINITTGTITLSTSAICTGLTLANNNVNNSFTIANGVTLTVNGNAIINQASGGGVVHALNVNGGTATVTGDVTMNVTANNAGRVAKITITTGTLTVGGNLTINNTLLAANGVIDMSGGAATLNLAGNFNVSTLGTLTPGNASTVNFNGSATQTIPAFSYHNLSSTNTGARTLASAGTISIAGTFTPGTNSYTTTGSTVNFSGTIAQTIPALNYNNLTSSSTGARTLSSTGTIGIAGTFTTGTNGYTTTASTVEFNGSVTQTIPALNYNNLTSSNTGTRTLAATGTIGIAGTFTPGSNSYTTTGSTVNFNGADQVIPALTYRNITCSGSGTKTFDAGTVSIAALTITAGVEALQTGGSVALTGAATLTGILSQSGGTLTSNGGITINSGGVLNQSGSGLIYMAGSTGVAPTDVITIAPNGVINQSGGTITTLDITINAGTPNAAYNQTGGTFTLYRDFINYGTFDATGGTIQFTNKIAKGTSAFPSTTALNQFYNVLIDAGIDPGFDALTGVTLKVRGNWSNNGAVNILDSKATTVEFNGSGPQVVQGSSVTRFRNLTINSSGTVTLAANQNVSNGNLTISSGTLDLSTYTLNRTSAGGILSIADGAKLVAGANIGGQTGSNFPLNYSSFSFSPTSTVEYDGSTAITQTIFAGPTYGHLTLTNGTASGSATKNTIANITVNGNLTINSGVVLTPADVNTVGGTGTLTGTGTAQVTRTIATPDFLSQYPITSRSLSNLTIDYNAVLSQIVSPVNYGNLTISGSRGINSVTFLSVGTTGIAGIFSPNETYTSGTRIMTGSTIDFNGSGDQIVPAITYHNLTASGAGSTKTSAGVLVINGILATNANVTLDMEVYDLGGILGTIINNGLIKTQSSSASALPIGRVWTGTIEYNKLTGGQTIVNGIYTNLTNSNTSGTNVVSADLVVNGVLTLNTSSTLDMLTNVLSGTLTSVSGIGTLKTQNTSAAPIPAGKTWSGAIYYDGSAAQTIVRGNYNNLNGTGGDRTFSSTGSIGIAGTFTPGAGTYTVTNSQVDFNGVGAAQTIPAFTFHHLTASGGGIKSIGGSVIIKDAIRVSDNTTLALAANNITLISDSLTTARVGLVASTASISYGTGRFVVERYVPGRRKYRLMTSSVTTSPNATLTAGEEALSIWGNWQNGGDNTLQNIGTYITGGTSADGFDQQTTNASLFTYDNVNKRYVGFTSANGKNTKYTPLKAGVPYYMFVYGDRQNTITASIPRSTVLKATGKILTGDQVYNTSSAIPLTSVVGRFTMLGNPYACTIDWKSVLKAGVSKTTWGWDANMSSTGAYVTVTATAGGAIVSPVSSLVKVSRYIQPGQAFFVQTTAANPQILITENDKVDSAVWISNRVFRTAGAEENTQPLIAVNLLYTSAGVQALADGAVAAFDEAFSNEVTDEDGLKMLNSTEGVAIVKRNALLGIETRPMPADNDTLHLDISKLTKSQYTLQIFGNKLPSTNLKAFLLDKYLNTVTPLSLTDTNNIVININTSDAGSTSVSRFKIVFKQSGVLPVTFTSVTAVEKDKKIDVEWKVASEAGVQRYEVEYSNDGTTFSKKGELLARGNNNSIETYTWLDVNSHPGYNYYRIKSVRADGTFVFSKTAVVKVEGAKSSMTIYPNPVKNYVVNLQFSQVQKGSYSLLIFSPRGRLVYSKVIEHPGGSTTKAISLETKLPAGIYYLKIKNATAEHSQTLYIE